MPDNLSTVVESVRQKLPRYSDVFKRNEGFTRYVLIDPVLRALGWLTDDPELVHVEYNVSGDWLRGPSADYALMAGREEPRVFIEVKPLGGKLDAAVRQCVEDIQKCKCGGVSSFIVSDGQKYERYDLVGGQPQKVAESDILDGDTSQAIESLVNTVGRPPTAAIAAGQMR